MTDMKNDRTAFHPTETPPGSIPSVASAGRFSGTSGRGILLVIFAAGFAAMALALWLGMKNTGDGKPKVPAGEAAMSSITSSRTLTKGTLLEEEKPEPPREKPAEEEGKSFFEPPEPVPEPEAARISEDRPREKTLTERKLEAPLLFQAASLTQAAAQGPAGSAQGRSAGSESELGVRLRATATPAVSATRIRERSLTLSKGTFIDCILETRLDTSVPGMTACVVPRNIYSSDGRVLLIEKGSRATGEYRGSVTRGHARIFVLWTQIETPGGVVIALDSPGTDALGGSGLPGHVDNHWWARFGNALLFSLLEDGFDYAAARATEAQGGVNYYANSEDAMDELIREAVREATNIPSTLTKNQGERIGIMTARNLYFGSVYQLRAKR